MSKFLDGLTNVINSLANKRNQLTNNTFVSDNRMPFEESRALYKTGVGNKIVRLKAGYAVSDAVEFTSSTEQEIWVNKLEHKVELAARYMIAYGRGIMVLHKLGDDLSKPINKMDVNETMISVFSGDMVTTGRASYDLQDPRYLKPIIYTVRGNPIHYTRVIDFTYVEAPEFEAPNYLYGGISEFELIRNQLVNDGIIERSSAGIIEKSSNFIYKIKGFRESLQAGQDKSIIDYFSTLEEYRSIYGAVLMDGEDDATVLSQTLSNLSEINEMSLRRLSMVTGIPLSYLVGEAVRGLNATGDNEYLALIDMIKQLQTSYLKRPIWELADKLGLGERMFRKDQGVTDDDRAAHEGKLIDNAFKLYQMGEDGKEYLVDRGLSKKEDWESYWSEPKGESSENSQNQESK